MRRCCLLVHKQPSPALGHLEKVEGGGHILRIDNNFTFIGDVKKMHLPNVREGAFVPLNLAAHRIQRAEDGNETLPQLASFGFGDGSCSVQYLPPIRGAEDLFFRTMLKQSSLVTFFNQFCPRFICCSHIALRELLGPLL